MMGKWLGKGTQSETINLYPYVIGQKELSNLLVLFLEYCVDE